MGIKNEYQDVNRKHVKHAQTYLYNITQQKYTHHVQANTKDAQMQKNEKRNTSEKKKHNYNFVKKKAPTSPFPLINFFSCISNIQFIGLHNDEYVSIKTESVLSLRIVSA